jgi:hypothetical protein
MILRATFWPVFWWVASFTLPNEPSPSVLTTSYWPRRTFGAGSAALRSAVLGAGFGAGRTGSRRELVVDMDKDSSSSSIMEVMVGRQGGGSYEALLVGS